jgi:hypothetical protein
MIASENKKIIAKVLVTLVIPAVVLSGNPSLLFAPFYKGREKDKSILHDKRLLTSCSRNCQTLGVPRQSRGFTLGIN